MCWFFGNLFVNFANHENLIWHSCVTYVYIWLSCLFLSTSLKAGPSEPCLGSTKREGEDQTDAPTHQALVPKKEDFVLEEEIIDVSYFAMQCI